MDSGRMLSDFVCCERSDPQRCGFHMHMGTNSLGIWAQSIRTSVNPQWLEGYGGGMLLLTPPERLWCLSDHIKKVVVLSLCGLRMKNLPVSKN